MSSLAQIPLFVREEHPIADVFAFSKPARTFTGDFYFTHRDTDRLWFALGDVAGKGLPAAVIMAMIQEELEHRIASCATTKCDPSVTMQRLHAFLHPLMPRNRFATVVIGHLRDDGLLTIANAGHCPPLIARGKSIEQIGSTGPVAGILKGSRWRSTTRRLAPGDAILLYSDGLLEARSDDGEELGVERIMRAFDRVAGATPREIVEHVLAGANGHAFDDDVTLLAISARPPRPRAS
jgi:sigma-B regulation protein RsbU (phosphoserine phosphatase)